MNKPAKDKWHVYKDGSPGWNRKNKGITLSYIKAILKSCVPNHRMDTRNRYRADGFLA